METNFNKAIAYLYALENISNSNGTVSIKDAEDAIHLAYYGGFGNIITVDDSANVMISIYTKDGHHIINEPMLLMHLTPEFYKTTYNMDTKNIFRKCIDVDKLKEYLSINLIDFVESDNFLEESGYEIEDIKVSFYIHSTLNNLTAEDYFYNRFTIDYSRIKKWIENEKV